MSQRASSSTFAQPTFVTSAAAAGELSPKHPQSILYPLAIAVKMAMMKTISIPEMRNDAAFSLYENSSIAPVIISTQGKISAGTFRAA